MIPCQPRAAPKAVVLWSKGTEILVNSSRYDEPSPSAPSDSASTPPPGLPPASRNHRVFPGQPGVLHPCCRVTVTPDGTLIIRNVSRSDEGKYTCFAENFMGKANSTGTLSVRGEGDGLAAVGGSGSAGRPPSPASGSPVPVFLPVPFFFFN